MYKFDAVCFRVNDVTETVAQGILQAALYLAVLGAAERAGLVGVRRSMRTTMSTRVCRVTVATAAAVTRVTMTAAGAAVVTAAAAGVAAAVTSTAVSAVAAATLVVMVTLSGSTHAAEIQL